MAMLGEMIIWVHLPKREELLFRTSQIHFRSCLKRSGVRGRHGVAKGFQDGVRLDDLVLLESSPQLGTINTYTLYTYSMLMIR